MIREATFLIPFDDKWCINCDLFKELLSTDPNSTLDRIWFLDGVEEKTLTNFDDYKSIFKENEYGIFEKSKEPDGINPYLDVHFLFFLLVLDRSYVSS